MSRDAGDTGVLGVRAAALAHVRLRWRLLRGSLRHGGAEQVGAVLSTVASAIVGGGLAIGAFSVGRGNDEADVFIVVFLALVTAAVIGFGIVAGIAQPIDPRVLAADPLSDRERIAGQLAASATGPPGLAGIVAGIGVVGGMARVWTTAPVVVLAALAWLAGLLLAARTATNLLALLVSRAPRLGQLTVGVAGLVCYGSFQFVPGLLGGLDRTQRERLADVAAWTPPGQLGRAMAAAPAHPGAAWGHLAAGAAWLVVLVPVFAVTTVRLARSVRRAGPRESDAQRSPIARLVRRACGDGPAGAVAWRSILVRFRTPRTALEAFTGAGVGLSAVLVPTLLRDAAGSGAVLVGGAVQLAVLFMSGNSFGNDGPPLAHELLTGVDPRALVRGKARSIAVVAAPLAAVGPVIAAAVTGEWRYFPAGVGVGIGGLLAGTGAALVQSTFVPISMPESDNPFASGETGKGMVAALLLVIVLTGLAIATVPVALALLWAVDREHTTLVTLLGLLTIGVGIGVERAGIAIATARIVRAEPDFVAAVAPAR